MTVITHRWNGSTLATGESLRIAAESSKANLGGADLGGADLGGADLGGADLGGADLGGANLIVADLRGANLRRADLGGAALIGADVREADLIGADLRGADLGGADLGGANLIVADLRGANLRGADLGGADLIGADVREADLGGAILRGATIPIIPDIDRAILAAIRADGNALEMGHFHTCDTTHCRAGWAIHLAGERGYALEAEIGPRAAGALIYAASRPHQPVPDFYASYEDAMADLLACAARRPEG